MAVVRPGIAAPAGGSATRTIRLDVGGMTCASCAGRVRRGLERVPGVQADVDVMSGTATVRTTTDVGLAVLLEAVRAAGYDAHLDAPDDARLDGPSSASIDGTDRSLLRRLVVAGVCFVPVLDLSMAAAFAPSHLFPGWRVVLVLLVAIVGVWCAWPFHRAAVRLARHAAVSMDTLVSLSIVASCVLSATALSAPMSELTATSGLDILLHPQGPVYLDVVVGVTFFTLLGRVLEGRARSRATASLGSVVDLIGSSATRLDPGGTRSVVPVETLQVGDLVVVAAGDTVPVDGVVQIGDSTVDTRAFSGESAPQSVSSGSAVSCGMVNLTGPVTVRVERAGRHTRLAQLVAMVREAKAHRAPVHQAVERIVEAFVPAVVLVAVLTGAGWLAAGATWTEASTIALAVLVVACPCALGLATPAALTVASGRAAQLGIFVRDQGALETLGTVDTVLVDKTGTLTLGVMSLSDVMTIPGTNPHPVTLALLRESRHPVSRAIAGALLDRGVDAAEVHAITERHGAGMSGTYEQTSVVAGSMAFIADSGAVVTPDVRRWHDEQAVQGRSITCAAIGDEVVAAYAVSDTVKPTAAPAVRALRSLGLDVTVVSGDHDAAVRAVGAEVGVTDVHAETSPQAKAALAQRLQAAGHRVAVLGDGINDAPALACADVGIVVAHGTDAAQQAGDITLLRNDLDLVPTAIRLSRATRRTIAQNLVWALVYNALAVPVAAAGLLNPLLASVAMAASSLLVVLNSLRLARLQPATQSVVDP